MWQREGKHQVREVVTHVCALSGVGLVNVVDVEGTSEPEEAVYVP